MGHVYYHHPDDRQFSLDFVSPSSDAIVENLVSYDADVAAKVLRYDLDQEFYVVYTSRTGGVPANGIGFELRAALSEMDDDDGTIVARLLEMYEAVLDQNEREEGTPVEAYKNVDIEALPAALEEVSWEGSVTEVAGRLASNVILNHALPNANHRTAVALVQFYLRRIDPEFSMPETKTAIDPETYDWKGWVNEYINQSKRLLTVRRKNVLLKHLRNLGATIAERKHGIEIDLTEFDLDMHIHEAHRVYAEVHEELWIEFVEEAVERAGKSELTAEPALSKEEFAAEIRGLE